MTIVDRPQPQLERLNPNKPVPQKTSPSIRDVEGKRARVIKLPFFYETNGHINLDPWTKRFPGIHIPKLDARQRARFSPHMTYILLNPIIVPLPQYNRTIIVGEVAFRLPRPTHHRARPLIPRIGILVSNLPNIVDEPGIVLPESLLTPIREGDIWMHEQSIVYRGSIVTVLNELGRSSDIQELFGNLLCLRHSMRLEP